MHIEQVDKQQLKDNGLACLVKSVERDGLIFLTQKGIPVCCITPLSKKGVLNTVKKINELSTCDNYILSDFDDETLENISIFRKWQHAILEAMSSQDYGSFADVGLR